MKKKKNMALTLGRVEEYEVLLDSLNNPFHILALSENWIKVDNVDNVSFYSYEHIYNARPVSDNNDGRGSFIFHQK